MSSFEHAIDADLLADILSVSKTTVSQWEKSGKITAILDTTGHKRYALESLQSFDVVRQMLESTWNQEILIKPVRPFSSIELFAGAGGLAVGLEKAGFQAVALNEWDKHACNTLRTNRPHWNILEGDIQQIDFKIFKGIDFISGGFPCQAFSYAGKQLGFEDTRGTLFFEFARAIKETQPKVFLGENVRGLLEHDQGKTLATIRAVIADLGYSLIEPKVLKAIFYQVPQKRERLMLVGIRNDVLKYAKFTWPALCQRIFVLRDALKAGALYPQDVPDSVGQQYPARKAEIFKFVPQGGYWRDLPDELQREYMQGSYFLGGGKTGMARRLAWNTPSLTLTCSPAQKQTERCHPEEHRPLTVREYARIQTFPDDWAFSGPISSQYKQIGNAVPVNLGFAMGRSLIALLNSIESKIEVSKAEIKNPEACEVVQLGLFDKKCA
ncbi:DNA (cytosine-5-)-methyltransferase [Beggiatoa leptomitoformis]|uniref:Cytosine-specific methyltransferase n=1 Tax=Beggiatoa leptomitoformis TaxID=288004 RepID=A0A2N9YDJ1_9GAMM|nr:DNA (cytosine-5-)-methyltransferase [Beggiatoa leptomitoformis]AUI68429.2 DNA (cytosine-5-)-methyltransferase [Beggiatoa leptomitoformis]